MPFLITGKTRKNYHSFLLNGVLTGFWKMDIQFAHFMGAITFLGHLDL